VPTETADSQALAVVAALREEVRRLSERVAALEGATGASAHTAPVTPAAPPQIEVISEEILAVISAAIAGFLGKKPSIRQIRLMGTAAWAQQGRVMIQASHALSGRQTGRPH
jgi:methylmalonyl-CoA carboxyltransferase large subunit